MDADTTDAILVAIYDDGFGTFQARCLSCSWCGRWYRSEALAVQAGQDPPPLKSPFAPQKGILDTKSPIWFNENMNEITDSEWAEYEASMADVCECELDYRCHLHAGQLTHLETRYKGLDAEEAIAYGRYEDA